MMTKKIGLLYSLTGTIAVVGEGQLKASMLAIEEINKSNLIKFVPVIADAKSNPDLAARDAYHLYANSKVDVLVGCYMSSVRDSVISVLNETKGLLLYPTVYEGEQIHPNIFYLGAIPNQQIEPVLSWAMNNESTNFVLVGSDYVYPRATNKQVKQYVESAGGHVFLESYFPLGSEKFDIFFSRLKHLSTRLPSLIVFSTIVGTSVASFYKAFKKNNIAFPIVSPITSEREIQAMGPDAAQGHICTSAYFQTIDSDRNQRFCESFRQRYGNEPISREMASCYDTIHLLAESYDKISRTAEPKNEKETLRTALKTSSYNAVQGKVIMAPNAQHLWQWSRIGRVAQDGQIRAFWESPGPLPPKHHNPRAGPSNFIELNSAGNAVFAKLIGTNQRFRECVKIAEIASQTTANILITGETGTGKELFARAIHSNSSRSSCPFVPINCASIPRDLIASELFGYEGGTFTGAKKEGKAGKFEKADRGTLFLDEIGEMPSDMQANLLRVLEDKQIYRVGGTEPIQLDVRLIASTNRDIEYAINSAKSFRKDLFYRLSVFHLNLPALRDRPDDIPLLAEHFLNCLCFAKAIRKSLSPQVTELMINYSWPGNIRELRNNIESAFYLSLDYHYIGPEHLPDCLRNSENTHLTVSCESDFDQFNNNRQPISSTPENRNERYLSEHQPFKFASTLLQKNERQLIEAILRENRFNISKASRLLGLSRTTLYRKIKKYNLA